MNEEELGLDTSGDPSVEGDHTANLSDDDIASALGFHTTLSEPLLPQDEMDTAQDEATDTADESPATAADAAADPATEEPPKDPNVEQDSEIADIRKELEDLKASLENDDKEPETEKDSGASE